MNFTVIANCQSGPIGTIISSMSQKLKYKPVKPIYLVNATDLIDYDKVIETTEIIIHQPIGLKFNQFAIEKIKLRFPDKLYISFPSLYFLGYWPGMMYLRKPGGGTMKGILGDHHDQRIVSAFLEGKSVMQTTQLLSEPVQNDFFEKEFLKLKTREESLDVKSSKFLIENFQRTKLFHVMNHPSNYLLIHVAMQIMKCLDIIPDKVSLENINKQREYLNTFIAPVDIGVRRAIDITFKCDGNYYFISDNGSKKWTLKEYLDASFMIYENESNLAEIFSHALRLRLEMGY
ncbi:MAG: WcbI family polysaccharide biosynthesis putative acetyltransferase [Methylococcaceae bacterium]